MGKLLGINRSARKRIVASGSPPFVPELIELLESDEWNHFESFFPAERNDYAHRRLGISEDQAERELAKIEPELKKLLNRIQWLRRYRFGSFVGVRRVKRGGSGYTAQWRASRGREEDAEPVRIRSATEVPGDEVVLLDPELDKALVLSPFFFRSDCQGSYQYLWLDRLVGDDKESVRYRHPVLVEQCEDVRIRIDRERVNFSEYRESPSDWHRFQTLELDEVSIENLLSARFPASFEESYREIGLVGQGGMSRVYEVEKVGLEKRMALKVLMVEQLENDREVKRFHQEALLLANLEHPGIVKVFHVDQTDEGRPFIEMEFLDGQTLQDAIDEQDDRYVPEHRQHRPV